MRPVRPLASKLPIVIAVVTVRAKDAGAHYAPLCVTVQVPHEFQETRLSKLALPVVGHRMTGDRICAELRNEIERVAGRVHARRVIAKYCQLLLPRAGRVTTETDLVLINCRADYGDTIRGANAIRPVLG